MGIAVCRMNDTVMTAAVITSNHEISAMSGYGRPVAGATRIRYLVGPAICAAFVALFEDADERDLFAAAG
jgi:hypothetical protein